MTIKTKICGITTPEALDAAIGGGASHVGLNFFPKSPRYVTPEQAAGLVSRAAGRVTPVALFVNEDPGQIAAVRAMAGISIVQLHGDESPGFAASLGGDVWKAIPVKAREDLNAAGLFKGAVSQILYDAKAPKGADLPGGTGMRFDWSLLDGFVHPLPWILAGGLDPANVRDAIGQTGASFVDVSSGVEDAPGVKSVDKIAAFLKAAREQ